MRLLVTGTGRCGTGYLAALLTRMGLPCSHEVAYGPRGPAGWQTVAEASWMAVPWLHEHDGAVLHLVRHPLDVVWSLVRLGLFHDGPLGGKHGLHRVFLEQHAPEAFEAREPLERAARFVWDWNLRIELYVDWRLRVEHIEDQETKVACAVSATGRQWSGDAFRGALADTPTTTNARKGPVAIDRPVWDDLPKPIGAALREQAAAYGYEEEPP